jgi:hypothetical protein
MTTEGLARMAPCLQAAYVALDNMEAEELEAISAESALTWKEQQALLREMARAKHASKVATIRLAHHLAFPDAPQNSFGGVAGGREPSPGTGTSAVSIEQLQHDIQTEEANIARLRSELSENRRSLQSLSDEIPERIVSSQRVSQLRLAMKHQQAATDAVRFKQQARSKVALMQELLSVWHEAIPEALRDVMLSAFDLALVGGSEISPPVPPSGATVASDGFGSLQGVEPRVAPRYGRAGAAGTFGAHHGAAHHGAAHHGAAGTFGAAAAAAAAAAMEKPIRSARDGGAPSPAPPVDFVNGAGGAGSLSVEVEGDEARHRTAYGEEEEEEGDDENTALDDDNDNDDDLQVLERNGTATPWRTLGALAFQAAMAESKRDRCAGADEGEGEGGDDGADEGLSTSAVVRRASDDL